MLTQERLKELLFYDPETGLFIWIMDRGHHRCQPGMIAGSIDTHGYVQISIDGVKHLAHRLAWLYIKGEWPPMKIDHDNSIRHDNKWYNLKLATDQENAEHRKGANDGSTTGLLGVYPCGNRFVASVCRNYKQIHIGVYATPEEASKARKQFLEAVDIAA